MMSVPAQPKIYHIVHIDRLTTIIAEQHLLCDAETIKRKLVGTSIGMSKIKDRRLNKLTLNSCPDLHVGDCVPFYFCPRSVMLWILHVGNHPDITYREGQDSIIHLEADLHKVVTWANIHGYRWAFTLSNAGAYYFEDRNDLAQLDEINWDAVAATRWGGPGVPSEVAEGKQAEFLMESSFPWHLVERIGVCTQGVHQQVLSALPVNSHKPQVELTRAWYY